MLGSDEERKLDQCERPGCQRQPKRRWIWTTVPYEGLPCDECGQRHRLCSTHMDIVEQTRFLYWADTPKGGPRLTFQMCPVTIFTSLEFA